MIRKITLVLVLIYSCGRDQSTSPVDEGLVSTSAVTQNTDVESYTKLQGEWLQLEDSIVWNFHGKELTWGSFEHPYSAKNNQLFVTNFIYKMSFNNSDTLILFNEDTEEKIKLLKIK